MDLHRANTHTHQLTTNERTAWVQMNTIQLLMTLGLTVWLTGWWWREQRINQICNPPEANEWMTTSLTRVYFNYRSQLALFNKTTSVSQRQPADIYIFIMNIIYNVSSASFIFLSLDCYITVNESSENRLHHDPVNHYVPFKLNLNSKSMLTYAQTNRDENGGMPCAQYNISISTSA